MTRSPVPWEGAWIIYKNFVPSLSMPWRLSHRTWKGHYFSSCEQISYGHDYLIQLRGEASRGSPFYLVFLPSGRYDRSSTPSTILTIFSISLLCFSHCSWDMFSCLLNMLWSGLRYDPPMRSQRVVYWP